MLIANNQACIENCANDIIICICNFLNMGTILRLSLCSNNYAALIQSKDFWKRKIDYHFPLFPHKISYSMHYYQWMDLIDKGCETISKQLNHVKFLTIDIKERIISKIIDIGPNGLILSDTIDQFIADSFAIQINTKKYLLKLHLNPSLQLILSRSMKKFKKSMTND